MDEFNIIENFFNQNPIKRLDVMLGIGDDAAIVRVPANHELVITTDTLIAGRHFPLATSAFSIGYKSLAVNLSDLAAMGATPAWITLALSMPSQNEAWLKEFSQGLFSLCKQFNVQLIGGDLTKGPLSITIQALGFVPSNQALRRDGAKPGDLIYLTNTLGDAALGLLFAEKKVTIPESFQKIILKKLNEPTPQIEIGEKLRGVATSAIDISDGFVADLQHILKKSHVGASIILDQLPLSKALSCLPYEKALPLALTGGDDYELCFTVPANKTVDLENCTCIGETTETLTLDLRYNNGEKYHGPLLGYQHF